MTWSVLRESRRPDGYGERGPHEGSLRSKVSMIKELVMEVCDDVERMEAGQYGERMYQPREQYRDGDSTMYGERRGYRIYEDDMYGERGHRRY